MIEPAVIIGVRVDDHAITFVLAGGLDLSRAHRAPAGAACSARRIRARVPRSGSRRHRPGGDSRIPTR